MHACLRQRNVCFSQKSVVKVSKFIPQEEIFKKRREDCFKRSLVNSTQCSTQQINQIMQRFTNDNTVTYNTETNRSEYD